MRRFAALLSIMLFAICFGFSASVVSDSYTVSYVFELAKAYAAPFFASEIDGSKETTTLELTDSMTSAHIYLHVPGPVSTNRDLRNIKVTFGAFEQDGTALDPGLEYGITMQNVAGGLNYTPERGTSYKTGLGTGNKSYQTDERYVFLINYTFKTEDFLTFGGGTELTSNVTVEVDSL